MAKMTIDMDLSQICFDFGDGETFNQDFSAVAAVQAVEHLQAYHESIELAKLEAMSAFKSAIGLSDEEQKEEHVNAA